MPSSSPPAQEARPEPFTTDQTTRLLRCYPLRDLLPPLRRDPLGIRLGVEGSRVVTGVTPLAVIALLNVLQPVVGAGTERPERAAPVAARCED